MKDYLKHRCFINAKDKEWVLFLHGIGGDSGTFSAQIRDFNKHFNLLLPDLRGHGRSQNMQLAENISYTIELIAKDVFKLMDSLDIKKAHFVGGSFGAVLIRQMQEMQPERFLSVVMAGAVLRVKPFIYAVFKTGKTLAKVVNNYFLYKVLAFFVMPRKNHRQSRQAFIDRSRNIDPVEYKKWMVMFEVVKAKMDKLYKLPQKSPTILIMGDQDHVFLDDCIEYCKVQKETKLEIFDNCGHLTNIERHADFNKISLKFLLNGHHRQ